MDRENVGILNISVDRETVADRFHAHAAMHTTEAESWEHSVVVIRFNDASYRVQSLHILVLGSGCV